MKIVKSIMPYIIIILVVVLIRMFIATPVQVVGSSMQPNFYDDEILVLNKISYANKEFNRFDVVVIEYNSETIIKRIIGLPGEKIEYVDNALYIDDEIVNEFFEHYDTDDFNIEDIGYDIIPDDSYFVVGDNRNVSMDSRIIGVIKKEDIVGKVVFRIFPFSKFGFLE